ncbi:hypothetical protein QQ045_018876 [Rhodiola kirilowii]
MRIPSSPTSHVVQSSSSPSGILAVLQLPSASSIISSAPFPQIAQPYRFVSIARCIGRIFF